MDRSQDTSGDYGYDLVHEDLGTTTSEVAARRPAAAPRPAAPEPAGDYEYDEAHDFRSG
jgi:hypothetical protein